MSNVVHETNKQTNKKITAAVAWGAGEALVMEEVEVSPPQPLEIRIKVVSTAICCSDLAAWKHHVSVLYKSLSTNHNRYCL
jgi:D-arabinose 1-dehydrogenase-like Zn-dependent alcohol dehydrogenase